MNDLINPKELNKMAMLFTFQTAIDNFGGTTGYLNKEFIFNCKYEPIMDNKILFTVGGVGAVNYELPFYKITTVSSKKFSPGQVVKIGNVYFEIFKVMQEEQLPFLIKYLICRETQYAK